MAFNYCDVEAAVELTKDVHFILASRAIAEMLNIDLKMAYDFIKLIREI